VACGIRFIVKREWQEEDGTLTRAELGQIDSNAYQSAPDVGLTLSDTTPILTPLQDIITKVQIDRYCDSVRCYDSCRLRRPLIPHGPDEEGRNKRKALLIVSGGGDNHGRYTRKQIWSVVSEADVRTFALGTTELAESSWK
jgi:hypothetical protein